MKFVKNGISLFLVLTVNTFLSAQVESNDPVVADASNIEFGTEDLSEYFSFVEAESLVTDGAYERQIHKERIALPLNEIREADVMWSKRIWREIHTSEKINRRFSAGRMPFINVLMDIVQKKDDVQLFANEKFTQELEKNELWSRMSVVDSVEIWNYETEDYDLVVTHNELNLDEFTRFRIKEDWIFDTRSSEMVCRIIGIAPVREVIDPNTGFVRGQEVLFWINFPQIRDHLAKYEANNSNNDAVTLTWTDVWDMRLFNGQIIKESNAMDRRISSYSAGRDALLEAQKIREKMIDYEFDLWSN